MNDYDETFRCDLCDTRVPVSEYHYSGWTTCRGCYIMHTFDMHELVRYTTYIGEPGYVYYDQRLDGNSSDEE